MWECVVCEHTLCEHELCCCVCTRVRECMSVCVVSTLHLRAWMASSPLAYGAPRKAILGSEPGGILPSLGTQRFSAGDRQPASPLAPAWVRDSGNLQMPLGFVAFLTHPTPAEIFDKLYLWAIQQWVFCLWKRCCFLNIKLCYGTECAFQGIPAPNNGSPC